MKKGRIRRTFSDIIEAIKGTDQDFTKGNLGRAILLLSIPMVIEMSMESVFAVVDIYFVSRIGSEAVAVVGITESLMTILYAVSMGLGMGTTALVARRVGEKKYGDASVTAAQSIGIGFIASLPIAFIGFFYSKELLNVMGATEKMVTEGFGYPMIIIGANIVIMLIFIINAVFRGAGDAALSMRILFISNTINIILDPCLIFGLGPFPELGITGAALATVIGRGTGVIIQMFLLFNGHHRIKIVFNDFSLKVKLVKKIVKISLGGIGQFIIATSSWIGLVRIMSSFGSSVMAGYTIAIRIIIFLLLPAWGLSNAAATMIGQNLGAGKPKRAEASVILTAKINFLFLSGVAILNFLFAESLISIFTDVADVIDSGVNTLLFISLIFPVYAIGMVMIQGLNGSGDTKTPTIINLFSFWLLEIPVAYLLAVKLDFASFGVYYAIILADLSTAIIGVTIFRKGKWKKKKV